MADRIQHARDTLANWQTQNPVLLEGELGFATDDYGLFKLGDGVTAWNSLPWRGFDGNIVQETGTSENAVMSQNAVTEALSAIEDTVSAITSFEYVIADTLPTASASTKGKVYLIPAENTETQNIKDEYITIQIGSAYQWEQIGSTAVDLSGYYTQSEVDALLADKADDDSVVHLTGSEIIEGFKEINGIQIYEDGGIDLIDGVVEASEVDDYSFIIDSQGSNLQEQLDSKQDALTFDSKPTWRSTNAITSGAVYESLAPICDIEITSSGGTYTFDFTGVKFSDIVDAIYANKNCIVAYIDPTESFTFYFLDLNADGVTTIEFVSRRADKDWYLVLEEYTDDAIIQSNYFKSVQDALTFDSTPTSGSSNPVTSGGVYSAIEDAISSSSEIEGGYYY